MENGKETNEAMEIDEDSGANSVTKVIKTKRVRSIIRRSGQKGNPTRLDKTQISYFESCIIGEGSTGNVYEGFFKSEENAVAVKRVFSKHIDVYHRELRVWRGLGHNQITKKTINIVPLYDWTQLEEGEKKVQEVYYFAMELASFDLLQLVEGISEKKIYPTQTPEEIREKLIRFLKDAAKGLEWIHENNILHRDIKPENILIFNYGDMEVAKLGDFGTSRKLSKQSTGTNSLGRGTSEWMAPEAIIGLHRQKKFRNTRAVDIFSLGLTFHFTLSGGVHPFAYSEEHYFDRTSNIKDLAIMPSILLQNECVANHLCQWQMQKIEKDRPTISQVLNHPVFWDDCKSLQFLIDVAVALSEKANNEVIQISKMIDSFCTQFYIALSLNFNWEQLLGQEMFELLKKRKSSPREKKYKPASLISLLEVIRDKYVHYPDIKEELLQERYFGINNEFSEEKFRSFFLQKFPFIVILLYTVIGTYPLANFIVAYSPLRVINPLRKKYNIRKEPGESNIPYLQFTPREFIRH